MSMSYDVRRVGDVTILDIVGRIDISTARGSDTAPKRLREVIRELAERGQTSIVLNLNYVTYIDSSGIGELVAAITTLRNRGGDLKVIHPNTVVQHVLALTRLENVVEVLPDESSAVRALSSGDNAGAAKHG